MAWYWVLLIVVGCQGLFLLVWWLISRNSGRDLNKDLEDSTTKRLEEELAAEKKKGEEIATAYQTLTGKFREIATWYNTNRDQIKEEAIDDFKKLAGDPNNIDRWLDSFTSPMSANSEEESKEGG